MVIQGADVLRHAGIVLNKRTFEKIFEFSRSRLLTLLTRLLPLHEGWFLDHLNRRRLLNLIELVLWVFRNNLVLACNKVCAGLCFVVLVEVRMYFFDVIFQLGKRAWNFEAVPAPFLLFSCGIFFVSRAPRRPRKTTQVFSQVVLVDAGIGVFYVVVTFRACCFVFPEH